MASTLLSSLRESRGSVDRATSRPVTPPATWKVEIGSIRLWIVGPGQKQMHPASDVYYSGRIGSDRERAIAARAVEILNRSSLSDEAGAREISAALTEAERQISQGIALPPLVQGAPTPVPRMLRIATEDDLKRALAAIELVTGIPSSNLLDKTGHYNQRGDITRARHLLVAALFEICPDTSGSQMDRIIGLSRLTSRRMLTKHRQVFWKEPTYASHFSEILTLVS